MQRNDFESSVERDYLVIGQGIAGTVLAQSLASRGLTFWVIDAPNPESASHVAGGILDPVSGQKFTPAWRGREFLDASQKFFSDFQEDLGLDASLAQGVQRAFSNPDAPGWFAKRAQAWEEQGFRLEKLDLSQIPKQALTEWGGFSVPEGGAFSVTRILSAFRRSLKEKDQLIEGKIRWSDLVISESGVECLGLRARRVVLCLGHELLDFEDFAKSARWGNTRGEILDCEWPEQDWGGSVFKSHYALIPTEKKGRFRWAANYVNRTREASPTPESREILLQGFAQSFSQEAREKIQIIGQRAGIRLSVIDHMPVIGDLTHWGGAWDRVAVFTAFGSKGLLWSPLCASWLLDALEKKIAVPIEVSSRRLRRENVS
jgi:glycine/D-amino acid oxidase-like deaminating enzyme